MKMTNESFLRRIAAEIFSVENWGDRADPEKWGHGCLVMSRALLSIYRMLETYIDATYPGRKVEEETEEESEDD